MKAKNKAVTESGTRSPRQKAELLFDALLHDDLGHDLEEEIRTWYALHTDDTRDAVDAALQAVFEREELFEQNPGRKAYDKLREVMSSLGLSVKMAAPEDNRLQRGKEPLKLRRSKMLRIAAVFIPLIALAAASVLLIRNMGAGEVKMITVTADGEPRELILPDGSSVWISEHSSLAYPEDFMPNRYVALNGEAYFDVRDTGGAVTFTVRTSELEVKVHGTEFLVKEIEGENCTSVILHSGKVEVSAKSESIHMNPGDMVHYDHMSSSLSLGPIPEDYVDMRYGDLDFDHAAPSSILDHLGRYYMKDISYPSNIDVANELSIRFENTETLDEVLSTLMIFIEGYDYRVSGRQVVIYPN